MASLKAVPCSNNDDRISDDLVGRPPMKKLRRVSMEQQQQQHSSEEEKNNNGSSPRQGVGCIQQKQASFLKRRRVTLDEQGFMNDASSVNKKLKISSTSSISSSSSVSSTTSSPTNQSIDEKEEENNSVLSILSNPSSTDNGDAVEEAALCLTTTIRTNTTENEKVDITELDTSSPETGIVTPHPSSIDLLIHVDKVKKHEKERMISVDVEQTETDETKNEESVFGFVVDKAVVSVGENSTVKSIENREQQRQQQEHVGSRISFLGTSKRTIFLQLLVQLFMFVSYVYYKQSTSQLSFPSQDCIYVTGGGFSGFWFSIGRLQSIPEPKEHNYVCYSAGCLGSVATLANVTVDELYDIASTARDEFLRGERHRYDIVEYFVDNMLDTVVTSNHESDLINSFDKLHILTSVTDPTTKLPMSQMQSPTSMRHLRDLLIQTAWIPIAIGSHYSHHGHLDGAFSSFQHPKCNHKIGLAWDIDLLSNALNPNINGEKVTKFWNLGLEYGL